MAYVVGASDLVTRNQRPGRWVLAVGFGVLLAASPARAQRGDGHASAGGAHGGFAGGGVSGTHGSFGAGGAAFRGGVSRPTTSFHGPYVGSTRPGIALAPRLAGAPSTAFRSRPGAYPTRGYAAAARPNFYSRTPGANQSYSGGNHFPYRYRGNRFGYGYGYPAVFSTSLVYDPFLFDPLWAYGDPFWSADTGYTDSGFANYAGSNYADPGAYTPPSQQPAAPEGPQAYPSQQSQAYAPSPETEPGPWAPPRRPQTAPAPHQEAVVTIIYKDGRPPEHIRNYALTRSALLLTGSEMREIPLDEIDLAATERVNRATGVDFRLPQAY